ncbi:MAG: nicotinate (nicotinamide) nucleotide adenylyltransferase [Clostridia bacterium]|nr:nicotinate (nicotinamide) nucleotide adenylyltransferase [Clostridia bacterium]
MRKQDTVVVFGGSFNPPINSHFGIAQQVLNEYEQVEKIIFIPVNKKYEKDGLLENEHRYNMLKLITDKNENFTVSNIDMNGSRSLYTIETLEEIQKQYKDEQIWFLIGSDNLKELHTWKRAEDLVSKYKVLVMERNKDNIEEIIVKNELLNCYKENIIKLNEEIRSNYSSTYVRSQIKKQKSVRYLMPDEVYEYIKINNLYIE